MHEQQVRRIKELAAQRANEAYGQTLRELLSESSIPLSELTNDTHHVHTAILFDGKDAVVVRCEWQFTSDPEILARAVEAAKKEGRI